LDALFSFGFDAAIAPFGSGEEINLFTNEMDFFKQCAYRRGVCPGPDGRTHEYKIIFGKILIEWFWAGTYFKMKIANTTHTNN